MTDDMDDQKEGLEEKDKAHRSLSKLLGDLKDFQTSPIDKVTIGGNFRSSPRCPDCGKMIELDFLMCPECGFDLEQRPVEAPKGPVEKDLSEKQRQCPNPNSNLQSVKRKLVEILNQAGRSSDPKTQRNRHHANCY